jgi:hypothetical protein
LVTSEPEYASVAWNSVTITDWLQKTWAHMWNITVIIYWND